MTFQHLFVTFTFLIATTINHTQINIYIRRYNYFLIHTLNSTETTKTPVISIDPTWVILLFSYLFLSLFLSEFIESEEYKSYYNKRRKKNCYPLNNTCNTLSFKVYKEVRINERCSVPGIRIDVSNFIIAA